MSRDPIRTLTSYVPALVVRRFAVDPTPISQPTAERFGAAVLFADIRGFTALADQLARQGQVGTEYLAELLNDCFGQLITVIHEHGGEVTKFAGDALLALWPVPDDVMRLGQEAERALAEVVIRSAQCGLAIQDRLQVFEATGESQLRLQVGIGAGDVYSVHLGGVFNRWEFLLSGSPLAQMSRAKEAARPGQVVLSPEAWSLIQSQCLGTALSSGLVALGSAPETVTTSPKELPALPEEAKRSLQSYIPAAVLSHLEAGHEQWLSEMRRVVVLFIKLPGYGTSIKHPYRRTIPEAQAVMEALQRALYRYAGSINKLNVDDKGITLVAAFGLPPLSHRNDASRAVQAALEMQAALVKLNRQSAIGITMGWVFCGPVGSEQRREYTMVGNAVNMAARLMQAAEEGLQGEHALANTLCDEAVFDMIRQLSAENDALALGATFESLPSISVKGMAQPVDAYRPRLRASTRNQWQVNRRRTNVLVGKDEQRRLIEDRLHALSRSAIDAKGGLIIIESETGSGKSLLLDELREVAFRMRLRILEGGGNGLEQSTPYFAWRSVFQQLFEVDTFLVDHRTRRSDILRQLPPIRGERGFPAFAIRLAPLLNVVLPLELPENRTTAKMPLEVRHRTTQQYLLRLMQRQVEGTSRRKAQPTVLFLENGQWMDPYSWELALNVGQEIKPMVTIIATRPLCEQAEGRPLSHICQQLELADNVTRLRLSLLAKREVADLLWHELGLQAVPEGIIDILYRRTGGQPAFTVALARQWIELGLVAIDRGVARLLRQSELLEETPPPEAVRQAVTSRIERLSPVHQLMLKVAAIVGVSFDAETLQELYPLSREAQRIPDELQALAATGLIVPLQTGNHTEYRFASPLGWQVVSGLMPSLSRRHLRQNLSDRQLQD